MTYDDMIGLVRDIRQKYSESDPVRLCRDMDIVLAYEPMGIGSGACKGFFFRKMGVSMITVNSELTPTLRRIITAHELGHAVMHAAESIRIFNDYGLFDEVNKFEKEANFFAAELLLTDEDVLDALEEDATYAGAASALYVPVEFLDYKFRLMKWKGYKIRPPMTARPDFMKNMEVEYGEY